MRALWIGSILTIVIATGACSKKEEQCKQARANATAALKTFLDGAPWMSDESKKETIGQYERGENPGMMVPEGDASYAKFAAAHAEAQKVCGK